MVLDYHVVLGVAASVAGLAGYIPYFRDIFWSTTKPHLFSWLVWGIVDAIAFFAQVVKGGGPGTWVIGIAALGCFTIALFAIRRGEKSITTIDWICFVAAL